VHVVSRARHEQQSPRSAAGPSQDGAHALVDVLHADDSLSLLTFSDRIQLRASPDEPRERVHTLIEATQAQLTTSLVDASFTALVMADPTRGRPLVLIFSDGQDVGSWLTPEQALQVARSSELVVHAVVSTPEGAQMAFLRELTSATGGELWPAEHRELREVLLRTLEEFRKPLYPAVHGQRRRARGLAQDRRAAEAPRRDRFARARDTGARSRVRRIWPRPPRRRCTFRHIAVLEEALRSMRLRHLRRTTRIRAASSAEPRRWPRVGYQTHGNIPARTAGRRLLATTTHGGAGI